MEDRPELTEEQIEFLRGVLPEWLESGILTDEGAERLRLRYGLVEVAPPVLLPEESVDVELPETDALPLLTEESVGESSVCESSVVQADAVDFPEALSDVTPDPVPAPVPVPSSQSRKPVTPIAFGRWAVIALMVLGALMVGVGLISIVAANWGKCGVPIRCLGLGLTMLAIQYALVRREGRRSESPGRYQALAFLEAITFGAAIAMVVQIFNIPKATHDIYLGWTLSSLGIALLASSPPAALLAAVTGTVWFYHQTGIVFETQPLRYVLLAAYPVLQLAAFGLIGRRFRAGWLSMSLATAGTFLVAGLNWSGYPDVIRCIFVVEMLVVSQWRVLWAVWFPSRPWWFQVSVFGEAFVFGGAIGLVSQIFHIPFTNGDNFLYWTVSTLAITVLARSLPCVLLAAVTLLTWFWFQAGTTFDASPVRFVLTMFCPSLIVGGAWFLERYAGQSRRFFLLPLTGVLFVLFALWPDYAVALKLGFAVQLLLGSQIVTAYVMRRSDDETKSEIAATLQTYVFGFCIFLVMNVLHIPFGNGDVLLAFAATGVLSAFLVRGSGAPAFAAIPAALGWFCKQSDPNFAYEPVRCVLTALFPALMISVYGLMSYWNRKASLLLVLSVLGVIVGCVYNWETLSDGIRCCFLAQLLLGSQIATAYVVCRFGTGLMCEIAATLQTLVFGFCMFQMMSVLHIPFGSGDVLLVWAVISVLFAFLVRGWCAPGFAAILAFIAWFWVQSNPVFACEPMRCVLTSLFPVVMISVFGLMSYWNPKASILLALSVLGTIAGCVHNWGTLSDGIRCCLVAQMLLCTQVFLLWTQIKSSKVLEREAVCVLQCLSFGLAIGLLADIFHIKSGTGDAFAVWTVSNLATAFLAGSVGAGMVSVATLTLWFDRQALVSFDKTPVRYVLTGLFPTIHGAVLGILGWRVRGARWCMLAAVVATVFVIVTGWECYSPVLRCGFAMQLLIASQIGLLWALSSDLPKGFTDPLPPFQSMIFGLCIFLIFDAFQLQLPLGTSFWGAIALSSLGAYCTVRDQWTSGLALGAGAIWFLLQNGIVVASHPWRFAAVCLFLPAQLALMAGFIERMVPANVWRTGVVAVSILFNYLLLLVLCSDQMTGLAIHLMWLTVLVFGTQLLTLYQERDDPGNPRNGWSEILTRFVFMPTLFVLSFSKFFHPERFPVTSINPPLVIAVVGLVLCLVILWLMWREKSFACPGLVFGAHALGALSVAVAVGACSLNPNVVWFNLAVVVFGLADIVSGFITMRPKHFWCGLLLILVVAVLRFLEVKTDLLVKGLCFIILGLVIAGIAWMFERRLRMSQKTDAMIENDESKENHNNA